MRQALTDLRKLFDDFWSPPEAFLLDIGTSAEPLIARVRLGLTISLLIIPFTSLLFAGAEERETHLLGLGVIIWAILIAAIAYALVHRELRKPWLPMVTSLIDVSLVTAALIGFSLLGDPHQAVNSKVAFETYFLAIGATCLRYDLRLSVIAGLAAILEYSAVVLWVVLFHELDSSRYAPWIYGRFYWSEQISRVLILGLMTALATVVVYRLRRHRTLSNSDPLTGLYNRAYFEEFLAAEIRRSQRYTKSFAVAMLDIDRFKNFNDSYGHAGGDEALKTVALVIRQGVRRSDLVARYGGEEMVLVMPETTLNQARVRLEAIRVGVAGEAIKLPKREERVRLTVSAGVACWPADAENPDDLLHIADARLFHAKALGRNRVVSSSIAAASV
ncbi:MAG TPA: GGDEF domain-containing protein [Gemmatimonadales bacterium]|nr:GGDEF domain-containing protein [Gemmatimonadales bacterium]